MEEISDCSAALWPVEREREKSKENMSGLGILHNEVGTGKQKVLKWQSPFGVFSNFAGRDLSQ